MNMSFMRSVPQNSTKQEPELIRPTRSAAEIRAELAIASDSAENLTRKRETASHEVASAQRLYDAGIRDFALDHRQDEPARGELQAAVSKLDAYRRIADDFEGKIATLTSELAATELAEAIASGQEKIGPLIGVAEAALVQFEQAVIAVRKAEDNLFTKLFDVQTGLRQPLATLELTAEARKQRYSLNGRAQQIARANRYQINPDFETDGNENLGRVAREEYEQKVFHTFARSVSKARA
jgi:hypothetical protein